MPPLVTVSTCCSLRVRARWCSSYHVRSGSSVGQSFKLLLITFSWRFLLILAPERARCVGWAWPQTLPRWAVQLGNTLIAHFLYTCSLRRLKKERRLLCTQAKSILLRLSWCLPQEVKRVEVTCHLMHTDFPRVCFYTLERGCGWPMESTDCDTARI